MDEPAFISNRERKRRAKQDLHDRQKRQMILNLPAVARDKLLLGMTTEERSEYEKGLSRDSG